MATQASKDFESALTRLRNTSETSPVYAGRASAAIAYGVAALLGQQADAPKRTPRATKPSTTSSTSSTKDLA